MKAAARHDRVRRQHSDELAEDYVEAIDAMLVDRGLARVTDLQRTFGVSHVSVIRALKRLEERGLVVRAAKNGLQLTDSGKAMAVASAQRHSLVVRFLGALGVSGVQADADAEGMEHHLSRETLSAMERFLENR
ncbi:MAG TPA: iron dependent repressor, metal binding and dimerization domain protein [Oceanipulchritudo sp.]|nr:iron dependent repressor, metal binding and dimerization domain protein [Oceanipulchritudo sp.]